MNLESISEEWKSDSEIDRTELGDEVLKIPKLHRKYYDIYVNEKLILRKYEAEYKRMKLDKYEFYTQGPNEETVKKGWKFPAKGMLLKADVPMYLEADEDLINHSLKIGLQQEKIEYLESIIKTLNNRGYNINTAVTWYKFTSGG